MASITIRRLDEAIKNRLRLRAAEHGHSMEEEARSILRDALDRERPINLADLALEFRVSDWLAPDVIDSLTLRVNETAIPLTYEPGQPKGRLYHGVLPREVLARSGARTQLVFHVSRLAPVPTAPDQLLGIALSSLRIRPRG